MARTARPDEENLIQSVLVALNTALKQSSKKPTVGPQLGARAVSDVLGLRGNENTMISTYRYDSLECRSYGVDGLHRVDYYDTLHIHS